MTTTMEEEHESGKGGDGHTIDPQSFISSEKDDTNEVIQAYKERYTPKDEDRSKKDILFETQKAKNKMNQEGNAEIAKYESLLEKKKAGDEKFKEKEIREAVMAEKVKLEK